MTLPHQNMDIQLVLGKEENFKSGLFEGAKRKTV